MPICTATDVTVYTDISTGVTTITSLGLIPIVQERVNLITNNYFLSDIYLQDSMTFNATSGTITASGGNFEDEGFLATDEIFIWHSYRNDGYKALSAVSDKVLTVATSESVIAEATTRSILITVVSWPKAIKYLACQMIKYDYDDRKNVVAGISSRSLGPFSESYGNTNSQSNNAFGYPSTIIESLASYTIARLI